MNSVRKWLLFVFWGFQSLNAVSQDPGSLKRGLVYNLNKEGTNYVRFTFLNQTWIRYNWNNPGSTVYDVLEKETFDVGLRRTRLQFIGRLSDRFLLYGQFGQNNFNYLSVRKTGAFFHDMVTEYTLLKDNLYLGAGLNGWSGFGRFSSPAVASILTLDAPLFMQSTNDITDQFLRKLGVYAKGSLSGLEYRFSVSKPLAVQNSASFSPVLTTHSAFSAIPPKLHYQGYLCWQFLDKESNLVPYTQGSYLGTKRIVNIGFGETFQKDAFWQYSASGKDTLFSNLNLTGVDFFLDYPLNAIKHNSFTAYAGFFNMIMGKDYIRNNGPMAPTTGVAAGVNSFNGTGTAYPMIGSGKTYFVQSGYKFRDSLFNHLGTLQVFASIQYSDFTRIKQAVKVYDVGFNWLIVGNNSKITLNYQSRPVFRTDNLGDIVEQKSARRGCLVLQYQIMI